MTTQFPTNKDTFPQVLPSVTLDTADHTQVLHNNMNDAMNSVQTFLGNSSQETAKDVNTLRGRVKKLEADVLLVAPVVGTSASGLSPGSPPEAIWDSGAKTIAFKIPAGAPGADGTNGADGVALAGTVSDPTLAPIPSGAVRGVDVNFPAPLTYVPKIICTPVQLTVATSGGGTSTGIISNAGVTAAQWGTYRTPTAYNKTTGASGRIFIGQDTAEYGNQRGIVCFESAIKNQFDTVKGAVISKVRLEFTTGPDGTGAGRLTVHPSNLATPPAALPDATPGSVFAWIGKFGTSETMALNAKISVTLPTSWGAKFQDGTYTSIILGPQKNEDGSLYNSGYQGIVASTVKIFFEYTLTAGTTATEIDSIPVDVGVRNVTASGFRLVVRNASTLNETVQVNWIAAK